MTQFYSRIDTEFNGDVYSIPFSYINKSEINVYINDELFTNWEFLNDSQIKLLEIPSELPENPIVSIRRITDISEKIVDYTNQSMLREENINLSQDQLLNAVQEIYDNNIQFEIDTIQTIKDNQEEIIDTLEENRQEILDIQDTYEQESDAKFVAYQDELNTKFETVSEAAEKVNALEEAVNTAVEAATTASEQASIALEQANIALEQTQDIFNTGEQIKTDLNTQLEEIITDITEETNKQIENIQDVGFYMRDDKLYFINSEGEEEEFKSGGGGLPLGYIGQTTVPIDESLGLQRYANGSQMTIDNNTEPFVALIEKWAKLYPNMVTSTQEEWETIKTLSDFGQCGKYFINREQGYIQLPLVVNTQGLTDLSNFSNIVEAGSPNITGNSGTIRTGAGRTDITITGSGAITTYKGTGAGALALDGNSAYSPYDYINFDASLSNPIYGNSDTVQQEQIQYPYFIQVATGVEQSIDITRVTEINNPFFFGMSQYFESTPNNPSWLKSTGTYLSKAVYPDYYDWLLAERNNPNNLEPTCNVTKYGNVAEAKGVLSGFNTTSYAEIPVYPANMTSLEMHFKFTTGSEAETTTQAIFGNETVNRDCPQLSSTGNDGYGQVGINLSKTGSTWDCILIAPYYSHKTYEFHCIWDGSTVSATLTDEDNVTTEMTILSGSTSMNQIYWGKKIRLGLDVSTSPFFGSIDLTESYINVNGSRWWTGANAVKQVGTTDIITDYDYAINQEDETFRLPLLNGSEDLPSDRYEDVAIQETGKSYNAPANGWYYAFLVSSAAKGHWGLTNNSSGALSTSTNNTETGGAGISIYLPAKKSDSVALDYYNVNLSHEATKFRFIYAKGKGDLYYYVGEGIVNPQLVNVARMEEVKANKTDVDGQWVVKNADIMLNVSLNGSTSLEIDLSEILPNDGYDYECNISATLASTTTSGQESIIMVSSDNQATVTLCRCRPVGTAPTFAGGSGIIIVGLNRKIYLYRATNIYGTCGTIKITYYRRLGTNQ